MAVVAAKEAALYVLDVTVGRGRCCWAGCIHRMCLSAGQSITMAGSTTDCRRIPGRRFVGGRGYSGTGVVDVTGAVAVNVVAGACCRHTGAGQKVISAASTAIEAAKVGSRCKCDGNGTFAGGGM